MNFGSVVQANPHNTSAQQVVAVQNVGNVKMNLGSIFFRLGNNQFIITVPPTNQCVASTTVLNPGQSCNIGIQFAPTLPNQPNGLRQTGPRTDFLVVQDNAGNTNGSSQQFITLIGNATGVPAASLDKSSLVFPTTAMGSTSVK